MLVCVLGADIRMVKMRELTSGVLHTKFWLVDKKHIYIGSANMDWRSLTQVQYTLFNSRRTSKMTLGVSIALQIPPGSRVSKYVLCQLNIKQWLTSIHIHTTI